jgi:hypothetical protein
MLDTVRHATPEDLDELEPLLIELRALPQLRERKRGSFTRASRGFLHFHVDGPGFYADVRLADRNERVSVTTPDEQADFMSRVRASLGMARPASRD